MAAAAAAAAACWVLIRFDVYRVVDEMPWAYFPFVSPFPFSFFRFLFCSLLLLFFSFGLCRTKWRVIGMG